MSERAMPRADDQDLETALPAAQAGDEEAFRLLYRDLQPRLLRYLRALVGTEAEDVAADAWLQIARDLGSFSGDYDRFRGWASTIARHRALDHLRRIGRRPDSGVRVEDLTDLVGRDDPERDALDRLSTDSAIALISGLPRDQAEAVLLRVVVGLDAKEAGRVLGKRPGAVRTAAYRGLRRLAERLDARVGDGSDGSPPPGKDRTDPPGGAQPSPPPQKKPRKASRSRKPAPAPEASQSRTSSAAEARGPAEETHGVQAPPGSRPGGGPVGRSAMPVPPESQGDGSGTLDDRSEASDSRSEASDSRQVPGGLPQGSGAPGERTEPVGSPVGRAGAREHNNGTVGAPQVSKDASGRSPAPDANAAPNGTGYARGSGVSSQSQGGIGRRPPGGSTARDASGSVHDGRNGALPMDGSGLEPAGSHVEPQTSSNAKDAPNSVTADGALAGRRQAESERGARGRAFGMLWMGGLRGRSAWWAGPLGATGPLGGAAGFPADNAFSFFGRLRTGGAGRPSRPRSPGFPRRSGGSGRPGGPADASR
ncbi:sigma-70 family RNA polymerase sigma factor [Spirillospora sp. CA-255316]